MQRGGRGDMSTQHARSNRPTSLAACCSPCRGRATRCCGCAASPLAASARCMADLTQHWSKVRTLERALRRAVRYLLRLLGGLGCGPGRQARPGPSGKPGRPMACCFLYQLVCGHPHSGTKAAGAPGSRPAPHAAPLSSVGGAGLGGRPAPSSTRQDMSISRHACVGREWAKRHTWDRKSCAESELVVGDSDLRPVPIWPNRRWPGDGALGVVARCLHSSPAAIEELIDAMRVVS